MYVGRYLSFPAISAWVASSNACLPRKKDGAKTECVLIPPTRRRCRSVFPLESVSPRPFSLGSVGFPILGRSWREKTKTQERFNEGASTVIWEKKGLGRSAGSTTCQPLWVKYHLDCFYFPAIPFIFCRKKGEKQTPRYRGASAPQTLGF